MVWQTRFCRFLPTGENYNILCVAKCCFYSLKTCGDLVLSKLSSTILTTALAHFMSLSHFGNFCTISGFLIVIILFLLIYDQWSLTILLYRAVSLKKKGKETEKRPGKGGDRDMSDGGGKPRSRRSWERQIESSPRALRKRTPRLQISGLRNCERIISCCSKWPSLW